MILCPTHYIARRIITNHSSSVETRHNMTRIFYLMATLMSLPLLTLDSTERTFTRAPDDVILQSCVYIAL